MTRSDLALRRARRAYELAHVAAAVRALVVAGVLIAIAIGLHRSSNVLWLVGATLAASLAALAWRGGAWRRGAFAGVLAGLPPLLAPAIVFGCTPVQMWTCVLACLGAGAAVGMLVGSRAVEDASPSRFALGALATATLTGLLGCGVTGLGGAMGVVIGLTAGGLTGWVAARAHTT
jgi:hypothetical protein